ncbi:hypothetical protein ACN28I_00035 [Archangium gephyra]|uniref:hypothetical protein n=1 Tax=Archangium gephyra TaxID=48 RepID=UPI003B796DFC
MEALAAGEPMLPEWSSTDEIGDLAAATARAFGRQGLLRLAPRARGRAAPPAEQLGMSTTKQTEVLTHQATALQEAQVTAQEIEQTSAMAGQKAEGVLRHTERADDISRVGEPAIQQSLDGLQDIVTGERDGRRIRTLDERPGRSPASPPR